MCEEVLISVYPLQDEHIFSCGAVGEYAYILDKGDFKYQEYGLVARTFLRVGEVGSTLIDRETVHVRKNVPHDFFHGDYLGEASLWLDWRHRGDLIAKLEVVLLCLKACDFLNLAVSYPLLELAAARHSVRFTENILSLDESTDSWANDLFCSNDLGQD